MFDCNEKLDVDLSVLQPFNENDVPKPPTGHSSKPESGHNIENQLKFYIQKSIRNVCNDLLRDDEEKTFLVDKESLIKVLDRRVLIPGSQKLAEN